MLGGETSAPLFMRSRTGTSALSALTVRLKAGEIFLFQTANPIFFLKFQVAMFRNNINKQFHMLVSVLYAYKSNFIRPVHLGRV